MPHYLLAAHSTSRPPDTTEQPQEPPSPEQQRAWFAAVQELEATMEEAGAWVFSGALSDPGSATVVRDRDGDPVLTDGPFAESKEHLAGFYVIEAADLDEALDWGRRVTACVGAPIEVRPFTATGRLQSPPGLDA